MHQQPLRRVIQILAALGVFTSLFPWVFSYQGALFGYPLSLRAIGDLLGVLLILLGVATLLSARVRQFLNILASQCELLQKQEFQRILWGGTFLLLLGAVSHKLRAHQMLSTHAFDLGFFSNICWNIAHGNSFFSSMLERNFSGVHANWILAPISWIYAVWSDARVLLILQAVFMAAAIPILGWILVQRTTLPSAALVGTLMFACSPFYLHTLFNDFHPDTWQLPFLMAALWAYQENKPKWLLFFSLVAILAKEDVSVILAGFSLFLLLQRGWRRTGTVLLIGAVSIFLFQTRVVIPHFLGEGQESLLLGRYTFGHSFSEMALSLVTQPGLVLQALAHEPMKYWRFLNYFFPAAGLVFAAPVYLVPCVVSVLPHLLSQATTQLSLADIYALPSQPFVFVGAAAGFVSLLRFDGFRQRLSMVAGLCFIVAGLGVFNAPRTFRSLPRDRQRAFSEMQVLIPRDASIAAQQNLYPHFDTRRLAQLFPLEVSMSELQRRRLLNPEYVICDRIGNALPFDGPKLKESIEAMEKNESYEKIYDRSEFLLFRRRADEPERWQEL